MHIWPSVEASGLLPLGAILFTNIILSTSRQGPVCGRIDGKVKWASVRWEQGYHVYAPSSALLPTCLALCKLALSADWIYTLYSTIWSSPKLNLIASANRTFLGWNFRAIFTAHQKNSGSEVPGHLGSLFQYSICLEPVIITIFSQSIKWNSRLIGIHLIS